MELHQQGSLQQGEAKPTWVFYRNQPHDSHYPLQLLFSSFLTCKITGQDELLLLLSLKFFFPKVAGQVIRVREEAYALSKLFFRP